jgi:hypothetical protein
MTVDSVDDLGLKVGDKAKVAVKAISVLAVKEQMAYPSAPTWHCVRPPPGGSGMGCTPVRDHVTLVSVNATGQVASRVAKGSESDDSQLSTHDHLSLIRHQAGRRSCVRHLLELPPSGRRPGNRLG